MIVVTVGTQLPFDRLIAAMDRLAPTVDQKVFAQIGHGAYEPQHLDWARELAPAEFEAKLAAASVLVAHAGTGSLMAAQRFGKPLILFPRRADLGEHRNDHQLAMCAGLGGKAGIHIAVNEAELATLLQQPLRPADGAADAAARSRLTQGLRDALAQWS
jgi:UDP-N-acetylglucosamine transferase subunit ALG13